MNEPTEFAHASRDTVPMELALLYYSPEKRLILLRVQGPELGADVKDGYDDPEQIGLIPEGTTFVPGFYLFFGQQHPVDPLKYRGTILRLDGYKNLVGENAINNFLFNEPMVSDRLKKILSTGNFTNLSL